MLSGQPFRSGSGTGFGTGSGTVPARVRALVRILCRRRLDPIRSTLARSDPIRSDPIQDFAPVPFGRVAAPLGPVVSRRRLGRRSGLPIGARGMPTRSPSGAPRLALLGVPPGRVVVRTLPGLRLSAPMALERHPERTSYTRTTPERKPNRRRNHWAIWSYPHYQGALATQ